jgi:toxin ParE1/3/4
MNKPVYTSAAFRDLAEIAEYISRDKPGAASAWLEKIEATCLAIANNPTLGDEQLHLGQGIRATAVGRYVIFYRQSKGRAEVLRVICGDRDIKRL